MEIFSNKSGGMRRQGNSVSVVNISQGSIFCTTENYSKLPEGAGDSDEEQRVTKKKAG